MKRATYLGLIFIVLLALTACGPKESAKTVVGKAIESVKSLDVEAMHKYWGEDQFEDVDSSDADPDGKTDAMVALLVKNLDYQIIEAQEDKDTAIVKVQVTNIDMSSIMAEFVSGVFAEALSYAFLPEEQKPSQEELDEKYSDLMVALLGREDNPLVTNTVEITLTLTDNQWIITTNEDAIDAMFGGISSFSDAMNEAFNESGVTTEKNEKDMIFEIRNWVIADIWNVGFCDLSWYYGSGTSSTGGSIDPEFTRQQLEKAMEKKPEYDTYMSNLSAEYKDVSDIWAKVSEQIEILYADVESRDLAVTGKGLDTGLYSQYFLAFDKAYSELP